MTAPRVTVLMPVFNGEAFLGKTIDSILRQTYRDFELLAIDDASTDRTPDVLRSYDDERLRIVRNPHNLGLTRALNVGLREARGELVARQDADDISYPRRLARQTAFLDANPEIVALGTQFVSINRQGHRRPLHLWMKCETSLGIRWQLMFENAIVHSSVMFRRDVVANEFGGYDESFSRNQDFDLWTRIARRYPMRNLHEPLVAVRGWPASLSTGYSAASLQKIRDVCAAYGEDTLGFDVVAGAGLDTLIQGMSPRICPPLRTLRPFVLWIEQSYRRFVERWPEAAQTPEIRAHAASIIARLATISANESPAIMSRWYMEAARYHLPTFARGMVRFAAMSGRALFRRSQ